MSVFGENDSRLLSNFLQTHIFWNFNHISRMCNKINYRNIWFPKVIIILMMTAQGLFYNVFFEKDSHLNDVEFTEHLQTLLLNMKMTKSYAIVVCITEIYYIYSVNLCIQFESGKIRTRKNSLFGHFSHSAQKRTFSNFEAYLASCQASIMFFLWKW